MAGFGNGVDKTHRCPQLGLAEDANDTVVSKFLEEKKQNAIKEVIKGCKKDSNGIYYEILEQGTGAACGKGKHVTVEYKGYLTSGQIFDASSGFHPQGHEALDFTTDGGQMIPGFDLMVQEMKLNETRKMVIPPELAYGSRGIPQAGIDLWQKTL